MAIVVLLRCTAHAICSAHSAAPSHRRVCSWSRPCRLVVPRSLAVSYCRKVPTLTPCHLSLLLGLSLRSGTAAWVYWASWADSLQLFARREPAFAERLSASLAGSDSLPLALDSLRLAGHSLSAASFELPTWQDLSRMPPPQQHDDDPGADVTRGWQRSASRALDDFGDRALRRELDPTSAAMLDSRAGPYGALPPVAPF